MKVLKTEHHAGRVEDGARLCEDVGVDVHHEVPARRVLHHEAHVALNKRTSFNYISSVVSAGSIPARHPTLGPAE